MSVFKPRTKDNRVVSRSIWKHMATMLHHESAMTKCMLNLDRWCRGTKVVNCHLGQATLRPANWDTDPELKWVHPCGLTWWCPECCQLVTFFMWHGLWYPQERRPVTARNRGLFWQYRQVSSGNAGVVFPVDLPHDVFDYVDPGHGPILIDKILQFKVRVESHSNPVHERVVALLIVLV